MLKTSLINLVLRGLTLVCKFILLLFIARFLSPDELGVWGIVNITIAMSILFLGLDFYVFNTRELLARENTDRILLIRDQMIFHGLLYLIILPLLLGVFLFKIIAWKYIGWFYILLVLEHISQEMYRLLVTLSRPTMANTVLFLRSGAWIFLAIAVAYQYVSLRSLSTFWLSWLIGVAISIVLALVSLRNMPWKAAFGKPIDWPWLKKGAKIALPFFLATMSFMGIQFADRYFLQYFWGEATVGIYTFYVNIANVIHTFILTGVIMILYPRIVEAYEKNRFDQYKSLMNKMAIGIVGGLVILPPLAAVLITPVLDLVGKQIYAEQSSIFIIMLGTVSLLTLSYIPHYALFVRHLDKTIIWGTFAALAVAIIANSLLVPTYGLNGAAFATLSSMATLVIIKGAAAIINRGKQN
jgi:O-antigen/teichoic acid export membrane protein